MIVTWFLAGVFGFELLPFCAGALGLDGVCLDGIDLAGAALACNKWAAVSCRVSMCKLSFNLKLRDKDICLP